MSAEITPVEKDKQVKVNVQSGSDTVYGLGVIGAWVFYIGQAKDFRQGVIGFFKGIFWPAFLVYEALKFFSKE